MSTAERNQTLTIQTEASSDLPKPTGKMSWFQRHSETLKGLGFAVGIFAVSRMMATLAIYLGQVTTPGRSMRESFLSWDSGWYQNVVDNGYPHVAYDPTIPGSAANTIAFFPLYPMLVRGLGNVLPLTTLQAGIVVSLIGGAVGVCFMWLIGRQLLNARTANKSVALFCFFPGSVAILLMLTEGVMLAFAAASIYAVLNKRWVTAGVLAACATATRPTAVVLAVAFTWAAGVAIWQDRDWKALAAPILAPVGILAYFLFLWHHTGNFWAWTLVEDKGWGIGELGHFYAFKSFDIFFTNPLADLNASSTALAITLAAISVVLIALWRPPMTITIFVLATLVLSIFSGGWGSKIRYLVAAFPIAIAAARWAKDDIRFYSLLTMSAMALAVYAIIETQISISIL